jgi:heat shock factor-binding protein 1
MAFPLLYGCFAMWSKPALQQHACRHPAAICNVRACFTARALLCTQQTRFQAMSDGIAGRIDELGSRIDELDKSITQLIDQTGMEAAASSPARHSPSPHMA